MIRHVPPAYSSVDLDAIWSGCRAVVGMTGDEDRLIDRWLAERFAPNGYLLTDSGTSALRLAIGAAVAHSGGLPVALPAYTCFDVATAAEGCGAPVLLYDLDPRTLGPDLGSLRSCLERGAGTAVVAHLFGIPVDLEEVGAMLQEHGALQIEDAAQGAGAAYEGRPLGSFGSLSILSFGRGKGRTGGGGGALLWLDGRGSEVADRLTPLSGAGRGVRQVLAASALWALGRPGLYALPSSIPVLRLGETPHKEPTPVSAMPLGARAVLATALERLEVEEAKRRTNAERLSSELLGLPGLRSISAPHASVAGCLRLPMLFAGAGAWLKSGKARRLGIMPGYPRRLGDLERFRPAILNAAEGFTGAAELVRCLLTLPTHSRLESGDIDRICMYLSRTVQGPGVRFSVPGAPGLP